MNYSIDKLSKIIGKCQLALGKKTSIYSICGHRYFHWSIENDLTLTSKYDLDNELLKDSNVSLDVLNLNIVGDQRLNFNTTWLRDSCSSNSHAASRQRLLIPKDYRKELFSVKNVELCKPSEIPDMPMNLPNADVDLDHKLQDFDDRILKITWHDNHQSYFRLRWLVDLAKLCPEESLISSREHIESKNSSLKFKLPKDDFYSPNARNTVSNIQWNASTIESISSSVDYKDLMDEYKVDIDETGLNKNITCQASERRLKAIKNLTKQLVEFGLAKVINVPAEPGKILDVARSLAYEKITGYGVLFNVVVEPDEQHIAYSSQEFDLHSDLTYRETSPGTQLLHCIRDSTDGGLSYFSDAYSAANELRSNHLALFNILTTLPCSFIVKDPYRDVKFRQMHPVISIDYFGNIKHIYYAPFMLPPIGHLNDIKLFYLAIDKFTQILHDPINKFVTKMKPSDLFIFNNRRVLHGRSAYEATQSSRFLQGCYMDWDEIECLHEKLRTI